MWGCIQSSVRGQGKAMTSHVLLPSMTRMHTLKRVKSLPVIDLATLMDLEKYGKLSNEQEKKKKSILNEMRKACTNTGFFSVPLYEGPRPILPRGLIEQVYKQSKAFHMLPDEVKLKYHHSTSPTGRGWIPLYEEPAYTEGTIAHVESFDLARDIITIADVDRTVVGENIYPQELPGFKDDVTCIYENTSNLSNALFMAFAEMFGLDKNILLRKTSEQSHSLMRLLHYPKNNNPADDVHVGISCHTDFECFTLINQSAPGLQLSNSAGKWIDVPETSQSYIVILGDMLENWTNGELLATPHRVVNTTWERQSIVRFNGFESDALVEPHESFVSETKPPLYAPITQGNHIKLAMSSAANNRDKLTSSSAF